MIEVGRLCVKTAGRDATQYCVVVDVIDKTYVLVDGNVRRKKVNKAHIEPLSKKLDVKKGASTSEVLTAMQKAGIEKKKSAEPKAKKEKKEQVKAVKNVKTEKKSDKKTK